MTSLLRSAAGACLLAVAIVTGIISAGFPVALLHAGFDKGLIVGFFVANSLVAFGLAMASVRIRRPGLVARCLPVATTVSAVGLAMVALGGSPAAVLAGGVLSMAFVVTSPFVVRLLRAEQPDGSDSAWSAGVRWISVLGYVIGVGLFGLVAPIWPAPWGTPVALAPLVMLAAVPFAVAASLRVRGSGPTPPTDPRRVVPVSAALPALIVGIALVVLLKAADSLRLVYLPLYVIASGWSPTWVSAFFVLTAAIELAILPIIGRRVSAGSSARVLALGAVVGALSFAVTAAVGSIAALVVAQVLFALFTALYQALSPVVLGNLTGDGLAAGTGLFAALLQVGALVGVLAPLAVPGYHRSLFWIAVALCAIPAALLVTVLGRRRATVMDVDTAPAA
jgi:SET family sugar efflux transporter-like MFS transporter